MQAKICLEVPDNWEPGWCDNCPLSYEDSYYDEDDGYDYWYTCVLNAKAGSCPLEGKVKR